MDTAEFLRPLFYRNVAALFPLPSLLRISQNSYKVGRFTARILSAFVTELIEAVQDRRRPLPPLTSR